MRHSGDVMIVVMMCFQAVQAAVDHQLHSLSSSHPHQRVALVTFSDEVRTSIQTHS